MNSARGSCRSRSWAMPSVGIGDARASRGVACSETGTTSDFQRGCTIYAGHRPQASKSRGLRLRDPAGDDDDSLPCRASVPVVFARWPHLRSL